MSDKKISETPYKLLHDPDFIMWCMAPTEELDAVWRSWLEKYPDQRVKCQSLCNI